MKLPLPVNRQPKVAPTNAVTEAVASALLESLPEWDDQEAGFTVYDNSLRLPPVDIGELTKGMDREQIIRKCVTDLNFFSKFMMPEVCKLDYPELLEAVWRSWVDGLVVTSTQRVEFKAATAIPRGYTKTTLIKLFIAYTVMFSKQSFVVVVGSTDSNAQNIVADVMELFNSPQVRSVFGNWDVDVKNNSAELRKFAWLGKTVILFPKGAVTKLRGLNIDNRRPEVIIMDDIESEEVAKSDVESAKLASWVFNTLIPTFASDGGLALFVGNVYAYPGSLLNTLRRMRGWTKLILGAVLSDGKPLWGALHSLRKIIQAYQDAVVAGQARSWLAQYMNAVKDEVHNAADLPAIHKAAYDALATLGLDHDPLSLLTQADANYIVIDVATDKKDADDHALLVVSAYGDYLFCVAAHVGILSPQQAVQQSISMALENNAPSLFLEEVGYQYSFKSWWEEKVAEAKLESTLEMMTVSPERTNKVSRIVNAIEALNSGEFYIHPSLFGQFKSEVSEFDPTKKNNKDNLLDAIHYAPIVWRRRKEYLSYRQAKLKMQLQDKAYLRSRGLGADTPKLENAL